MEKEKFYSAKTKISKENAIKEFEKIIAKFEVAEMEVDPAEVFINKIRFGKLFIDEKGQLIYVLKDGLDRGKGSIEKSFVFDTPEQAAFTSNDIDLISIITAYQSGRTRDISENSISKTACIFIGISTDFCEKLSIKDSMSLFMMGCNLFFGS